MADMIPAEQKKMYRFLVVLTIASTLGLESWLTLFNNFAVEAVALEGIEVGFIQSIDYRIPFVCGAVFSLVSLAAVQKIKIISRPPGP